MMAASRDKAEHSYIVRPAAMSDVDALHAINEAAVPGVNSVPRGAFPALMEISDVTLVATDPAGRVAGFVLCLIEGLSYDSLNYAWISSHYPSFGYVDRVAVDAEVRGHGIGGLLYDAVEAHFRGRRPCVMAEVNLAPPNPGSLKFHRERGFQDVGMRWNDDRSKGVVYLERKLHA